jgi:hypothetical protein
MIATKTTTLLVTMAVLGIVPVAAHAQPIDITELVAQEGTATQISAPEQPTSAAVVDDDTNTNTPINFNIVQVGAFSPGTATTATQPFTASDEDVNAVSQTPTQTANQVPTATQTQSTTQAPTASVALTDLLGMLPGGG